MEIEYDEKKDREDSDLSKALAGLTWVAGMILLACSPAIVIAVWGRLL